MTITIRPLQAEDRAQWDILWNGYLTFYKSELTAEITDLTWQRLMTAGEDPKGFAAVNAAGELIGIVHYLYHRSTWSDGPYCYLEDLFVSQAARGTGAGRELIQAVYDAAKADGASRVYWATQEFNETARKLYDRMAELTPFVQYRMK